MKLFIVPLWCKRLSWLALIWLASVVTLGIFAYLLRFIMTAIGMTT
jgi:hypothetical protein